MRKLKYRESLKVTDAEVTEPVSGLSPLHRAAFTGAVLGIPATLSWLIMSAQAWTEEQKP